MDKIMPCVTLATALSLTIWSKRTFWRRFADGSIIRCADIENENKSMIELDSISPQLELSEENVQVIIDADRGDGEAQAELALVLIINSKYKSAIYWLKNAIKHGNANAMYWLGKIYIEGLGVSKNEYLGLMWIAKSAEHGNIFSKVQIDGMIKAVIKT